MRLLHASPKLLLLALLLCSLNFKMALAQGAPAIGNVLPEDLALKECAFDKTADAVIIYDKANSNYDNEYQLVTERRVKMKILKEGGVERGNIRIPFYSNNKFEYITNIDAVVITPEEKGGYTTSWLNRKNIFTRQVNRLYSEMTFALPNVKVGSIIEYRYNSVMKSYGGLNNWEFQGELPVLLSSYELYPLPNTEFAYTVYKKNYFPIRIVPNNKEGKILFEMSNIPGLRNEAFSSSARQYLQRVNFQFSGMKYQDGAKTTYMNTWRAVASELASDRNFGGQASKSLEVGDIMGNLPAGAPPVEKMKRIHQYVRSNMAWDHVYSKFSEAGVKGVQEKKKGNSADINLLLVSLLRSAGLEAYPLLVSERHHGSVDTAYPYLDQFNKVVAYVLIDGAYYVLDGTDYQTPSFMLPAQLLNTTAFIVDKKKYKLVKLAAVQHGQKEYVSVLGTLHPDGTIKGSSIVRKLEYAKLPNESSYKADRAGYQDAFLKSYPFLKVDSFKVDGVDKDSAALTHFVQFQYDLQKTGGYYLLNYNLFTDLDKNPFISDKRFSDIDFGTTYSGQFTSNFFIPPSLDIESMPASKMLVSGDRSMSVKRQFEKVGDKLGILVYVKIDRTRYEAEEYDMVKAFYKEMIDFLNEPVLFKSK